ncbi:MAG: DUF2268 domain-containing putative Zn-dependent protease, partial [Blastocatellia bacterium]
AKLITSDIENFWRAYDLAKQESDAEKKISIYDREYLGKGSVGLQDFIKLRINTAKSLAQTVNSQSKYYESARASTLRIAAMEKKIRAHFFALKYLYDEAAFPDVYFLIGKMNSGGTASGRALLIGAEMHAMTPQAPLSELSDWHKQVIRPVEDIPAIVAHELIHFQQKYPFKVTLLNQSIREGVADFLGEMISGFNLNQHLRAYGDEREKQLWDEFKQEMNGNKYDKWLYNGSSVKDRPADLGYYMGYRIAESYYNQAKDKKQAIKDILSIKDFEQFLQASGYQSKFGK